MYFNRPHASLALPETRPLVLPLRARVIDSLSCLLLESEDALEMLTIEEANDFLWLEPCLRRVYEEVNTAMCRMTD